MILILFWEIAINHEYFLIDIEITVGREVHHDDALAAERNETKVIIVVVIHLLYPLIIDVGGCLTFLFSVFFWDIEICKYARFCYVLLFNKLIESFSKELILWPLLTKENVHENNNNFDYKGNAFVTCQLFDLAFAIIRLNPIQLFKPYNRSSHSASGGKSVSRLSGCLGWKSEQKP